MWWNFFKRTPVVDYTNTISKMKNLFPHMSDAQKQGVVAILKATATLPAKQRAYILATVYHETAKTMQPITEYGGVRYFDKYDVGRLAAALGNSPEKDGDGYLYRGRGYVQLTGKTNYAKASRKLNIDFVNHPDLALVPDNASKILVLGMEEGWFTGKRLSNYISKDHSDYYNARRIINGVDKASTIKKYAEEFERVLISP